MEILRAISELIVYGSQGNDAERIFDYLCEKNMLAIFTRMLNTTNVGNSIKRQIIQTMSILVQNITNDTYFYYLLSNNHINEIISHPFNLANEDSGEYYEPGDTYDMATARTSTTDDEGKKEGDDGDSTKQQDEDDRKAKTIEDLRFKNS